MVLEQGQEPEVRNRGRVLARGERAGWLTDFLRPISGVCEPQGLRLPILSLHTYPSLSCQHTAEAS